MHYEAVAELRSLAGRFLREKTELHLGEGEARLDRMEKSLCELPAEHREHADCWITMLRSWASFRLDHPSL